MQLPDPNALFLEQFEEAEAQGRVVAGTPDHVREIVQTSIVVLHHSSRILLRHLR
jgi:hypothetical protein